MGENKGSFLINLIVMFILFLSMISIIFTLPGGRFFKFELTLLIIFLLFAIRLMSKVSRGIKSAWSGLLIFYTLNIINQLVIYFRTYVFMDIVLPLMVTGLGFLVALIKVKPADDFDLEEMPEAPKPEEVKVEKKAAKKKPAKKKTTKKKTSKKKK